VLAALVVITNLPRYSSSQATPGPAQREEALQTPPPLRGSAPWALSALPECFHQDAQRSGTPAFARAKFPAGAVPVPSGVRLVIADCTLDVERRSAVVVRGDNRLLVPPVARFYIAGKTLILDRVDGAHEDVRTYTLYGGTPPRFDRQP